MPMRSTTSMPSSMARMPAVSTMFSGMPSTWIVSLTLSRVVPAIGVTMATSEPASAFSSDDLPTVGWPSSS
jgi:hypothetical protein